MDDPKVQFGLIILDESNFSLNGIRELLIAQNYDAQLIGGNHLLIKKNGTSCELRLDEFSKVIWLAIAYVFKESVTEKEQHDWLKRNFKRYGFADISIKNNRLVLIEKLEDLYPFPAEYMVRRINYFMSSSVFINTDGSFK